MIYDKAALIIDYDSKLVSYVALGSIHADQVIQHYRTAIFNGTLNTGTYLFVAMNEKEADALVAKQAKYAEYFRVVAFDEIVICNDTYSKACAEELTEVIVKYTGLVDARKLLSIMQMVKTL